MRLIIFGKGRVGSAFAVYASDLGHEVDAVSHAEADGAEAALFRRIAHADLVAAAIPDGALAGFAARFGTAFQERPAIHFSGALIIPGMSSYHPLYSFPASPLPPAMTRRIAIAREDGARPFGEILPGAANPEFAVPSKDRALYHALAVLSGNFSAHLWNETAKIFAGEFPDAPAGTLNAYFQSLVDRFGESPEASMTGPLARRDGATVKANLEALSGAPHLEALYRAFLRSAWPEYDESSRKKP
ncbi:MAG: Rossmann-like and DUF2520 domain-containing protein [Parvularculaceae bacterium]